MSFSIYPEQGYFIDFHKFSQTAKIIRAIHIDATRTKKDMVGIIYSLIHDDIMEQSLEYMEEQRLALYTFTTQNDMYEFYYTKYGKIYPNETLSRSISPIGGTHIGMFFHTYGEALIYLYKHMQISDKIRENTIRKNGIDYKCFVKYMNRYIDEKPEEFI